MGTQFKQGVRPTFEQFVEEAAGLGIEFPEGSLQETQFVALCEVIWSHGFDTGVQRMYESHEKSMKEVFHADSV